MMKNVTIVFLVTNDGAQGKTAQKVIIAVGKE